MLPSSCFSIFLSHFNALIIIHWFVVTLLLVILLGFEPGSPCPASVCSELPLQPSVLLLFSFPLLESLQHCGHGRGDGSLPISRSWILRTEGRERFLPLPTDCPSGLLKVWTSWLSLGQEWSLGLILVLAALINVFKINCLFLANSWEHVFYIF